MGALFIFRTTAKGTVMAEKSEKFEKHTAQVEVEVQKTDADGRPKTTGGGSGHELSDVDVSHLLDAKTGLPKTNDDGAFIGLDGENAVSNTNPDPRVVKGTYSLGTLG